jgi:NAD-dependent dihydropyrimidine dehydrogenase PreA subunit
MTARTRKSLEATRHETLASGHVVPETSRCVQCGICNFNCPIRIDVRLHAWRGEHVVNPRCLTCGECVQRCPRGVLRFDRLKIFKEGGK